MNFTPFFRQLRPHLPFVLGFFVLASVYFIPAWQGKELPFQDVRQSYASTQELRNFRDQTGQFPLWTDALFGGMPAYLIAFDMTYTFVNKALNVVLNVFPVPVYLLLLGMLVAYIWLVVLGINRWLAALGGIGYALGSYALIYLEAGHVSQILALIYGPGILAGIALTLRGRYVIGGAVTALFICLEFGANHLQITYYVFLLAGLYVVIEAVWLARAGQVRQLVLALAVLVGAGALGAATFSKRLLVVNQYSKETIRGRAELTAKTTAPADVTTAPNTTAATAKPKDGLDATYAFEYSYQLPETFTLLIPNFYGGASGGGLDEKSAIYAAMINKGVDAASAKQFAELAAPTYWGDLPIAGGPAYAGAILLFLFVLGMIISQNRIKWFVLAATVLMVMIAWGKNFLILNGLLFDYFPYFNKFRAVTQTLLVAQLFIGAGGALGVQAVIDRKMTLANLRQPMLIALGATAGLALIFALLGGTFFTFRTKNDLGILGQYFGEQGANEMLTALVKDRQSLLQTDAFRSVIFILLAAGALWLFVAGRIKASLFYPVLLLLTTADLFMVDKRFLTNSDFQSKAQLNAVYEATPIDQQILQDKTLSYRVWEQSGDFMSSNRASASHKSIGGYHAAKLRRYQELITYALPKNTLGVLNMLNVRYVIQSQPDTATGQNQTFATQNPEALGNAWFVQQVQTVADADAEIAALSVSAFNPRTTALVDARFSKEVSGLPTVLDTTGSIALTKYIPDNLTYESNAPSERLAVFSEIFYRGQDDWKTLIDGKEVKHFRADYVLRALRIPAGKHTIQFKFEPPLVGLGNTIDLIANLLLLTLLGVALFVGIKNAPVSALPVAETPVPITPETPASIAPKTMATVTEKNQKRLPKRNK
jgi:hypothetical protein